MFNIGGGEILVILLLALIVLGPQKLPDAARRVGSMMGELKRMSAGFQAELRNAMEEPEPKPTPKAPQAVVAPPEETEEPSSEDEPPKDEDDEGSGAAPDAQAS